MALALEPWPLLRIGDNVHPVPSLQYHLRARGHRVAVDGVFGAATDAAVRAFQIESGLVVDGVAGPRTWAALVVTIRPGDQGDAVRSLQEEFNYTELSGSPVDAPVVDGVFGPRTETHVRKWQQLLHDRAEPDVVVDGVVGLKTWQMVICRLG
ncbi:peptidoglycan hydrolase-like protein with peptidoglycan-binding domain [Actinoplanes lutulentus]|uniref:Peptidoglycan hydrolase-like protein with peptidoglycan-binding domain n=2 Tax=Actinoplanes lutulentus TaxID=1287878 RepID=A0A327YVZ1_9ACTN|nr:peptidoglycan hydrolase-like protein with peptidoglycan-binding domain [Actinoplanes lutulentus]